MAKERTVTIEIYRPVVRLIISLVVISIISWVLTSLPMLGQVRIPGMPVSITAIISAIFGLIMITILSNFNREMVPKVQGRWQTFPEMGTIVKMSVLLMMIVIAYSSFDGVIIPFIYGISWVYPLAFLGLAILPLYTLGITLYRNVDKITDLITGSVAEVTGELVKCPQCGELNPTTTKFCPKCGASMASVTPRDRPIVVNCKKCGAENKSTDKFCSKCGSLLG